MKARFTSKCPGCGERIAEGSEITKRGRRYVCADCAAPADSAYGHAPGCHGECDGGCAEPPHPDYAAVQAERFPGVEHANDERVITIRTSGGTFYRNARGTCEDAPCCGCCTI